MIVQPSSLDPADTSPLSPSPAVLATAAPSWLIGFHGAVPTSGMDAGWDTGSAPLSLRSIALARRSLGTEPMSTLTDLPSLRRRLVAPASTNGARPVGAHGADPDADVVTPAAPAPISDPWLADEPLSGYLDRRLGKARVLYLPNAAAPTPASSGCWTSSARAVVDHRPAGHAGSRRADPAWTPPARRSSASSG